MRTGSRRGMTLLEVLLALGLLVVLTAFVMGVLSSVLGLWEAGERRGRGGLAFAAATERLRADLLALHNGPSGWLLLDRWEALPADDQRPAWMLPRLRFLAGGGGLPHDDPTGRAAVEVAWMLVPEDARNSRLTRLVRLSNPAGGEFSLSNDRVVEEAARAGAGLVLLDGVAQLELETVSAGGRRSAQYEAAAGTRAPFPAQLELRLERVAGNARRRPATLDQDLGAEDAAMALRGGAPPEMPGHALIEKEWVRVAGVFPRLVLAARGERGSAAAEHPAGAPVYLPATAVARFPVSAGGRRIAP